MTFVDVVGINKTKDELSETVSFLRGPLRHQLLGGRIPRDVLPMGAPGTDKTLSAEAVADKAGMPFLSMSGLEFVEVFINVGTARVQGLFSQAEFMASCTILIDELDILGKTRVFNLVGGNEECEQTLNQLLVETDGFDSDKGVIIMATTNRPEILDPALFCLGRLDRRVVLNRPDLKGREQTLKTHIKNVTLGADVDLDKIAARTPGFAGADLANLVNEAALLTVREGKSVVETTDFDQASDRTVGGLKKKSRVMSATKKETITYHEAGHTIAVECRPLADRASEAPTILRGIAVLGCTRQTPTEDHYLLKCSELPDRFDVLPGGYAAEQIMYHDVSTGAQNGSQRAVDMVRQMITQFGMSEQLGPAIYGQTPNPLLAGTGLMQYERKEYSEDTAQLIDMEVCKALSGADARVAATLEGQRAKLDALLHMLLGKEMVDCYDLDMILADNVTPMSPPRTEAGSPVGVPALVPAQQPHLR